MTDTVTIRRAEREDAGDLIALISALADFEELPRPEPDAQQRLIDDGFGDRPKFEVYLAELEGVPGPVGYAFIFETYSTFLARPSLYLEDLFVLPDYRKRGIGGKLLDRCIALAHERGCGRMEWACLTWNTNAQAVYRGLGASHLDDWMLFRLTRDDMRRRLEKPG